MPSPRASWHRRKVTSGSPLSIHPAFLKVKGLPRKEPRGQLPAKSSDSMRGSPKCWLKMWPDEGPGKSRLRKKGWWMVTSISPKEAAGGSAYRRAEGSWLYMLPWCQALPWLNPPKP